MKKHLEQSEIVLLCLNNADITSNSQDITAHIMSCPQCKQHLKTVETLVHESYQESAAECDQYLNYLRQKSDISVLPDDFNKHLEECEPCSFIYKACKTIPYPEEFVDIPLSVTADQLAKIDQNIELAIKKEKLQGLTRKTLEKTGEIIREKIIELTLILRPVPQPSAIRGKVMDQKIIFTHPGGQLKLHTGQPNATVKLCAIFQDKIFEKLADTCGDVTFANLVEDDYTVDIVGYEVTSIEKWSNRAHV